MTVALYLVTHEGIASPMLKIATAILNKAQQNIATIEIKMDADVAQSTQLASHAIEKLDTRDGLIIITDIYGGTPSNIASQLSDKFHSQFISGLNLPMLIRLLNYRNEALAPLMKKALDGAHDGISQH